MAKFKMKMSRKGKRIVWKSYKRSQNWRKNSEYRELQDPGVSNCLPFKDEILPAAELRKQRAEDLREAQKDCRLKLQMENRNIEDLVEEAMEILKVEDFKMFNDHKAEEEAESSSVKCKIFYEEFKKVVKSADVILEVLDARDPVGTRCPQVEQFVINTGKMLVLVLNKIDLIPKNNVNEWLKYLRQELPTVAFKASIQTLSNIFESGPNAVERFPSGTCIGDSFLIKLLRNYYRNLNIQTVIKVGVVGFPNVGKKSVICSLKKFQSRYHYYANPDITNLVQELSLDNKHIEILDEPGVVYAKDDSQVTLALHNAVKVEDLKDVISPAEAIFQRTDHAQLCLHYCLPQVSSCHELLSSLAAKMCRFKKVCVPDSEDGARRLINDWNSGKIKYYTHPPEKFIQSAYINAEYVAAMDKAFDISLIEEQLDLDNTPELFPTVGIVAESTGPTEGVVDEKIEAVDNALAKVPVEFNTDEESEESLIDFDELLERSLDRIRKLW